MSICNLTRIESADCFWKNFTQGSGGFLPHEFEEDESVLDSEGENSGGIREI